MSSGPGALGGLGGGGTSYGSSSNHPNRADQIMYRFYIKTVSVLVDGRVTHFGKGKRKEDRWVSHSSRSRQLQTSSKCPSVALGCSEMSF